jgi:hypothetical protein
MAGKLKSRCPAPHFPNRNPGVHACKDTHTWLKWFGADGKATQVHGLLEARGSGQLKLSRDSALLSKRIQRPTIKDNKVLQVEIALIATDLGSAYPLQIIP